MSSKENFGCHCDTWQNMNNAYKRTFTPSFRRIANQNSEGFCACDYFSKEEMAYSNPGPGGRYIIDTCCKSSERFFEPGRNVEGFEKKDYKICVPRVNKCPNENDVFLPFKSDSSKDCKSMGITYCGQEVKTEIVNQDEYCRENSNSFYCHTSMKEQRQQRPQRPPFPEQPQQRPAFVT